MITFRGDWTPEEQKQIQALNVPEALCTHNHTGYYFRLPEFKWDEVLWGDTVSKLVETVSRYQKEQTK